MSLEVDTLRSRAQQAEQANTAAKTRCSDLEDQLEDTARELERAMVATEAAKEAGALASRHSLLVEEQAAQAKAVVTSVEQRAADAEVWGKEMEQALGVATSRAEAAERLAAQVSASLEALKNKTSNDESSALVNAAAAAQAEEQLANLRRQLDAADSATVAAAESCNAKEVLLDTERRLREQAEYLAGQLQQELRLSHLGTPAYHAYVPMSPQRLMSQSAAPRYTEVERDVSPGRFAAVLAASRRRHADATRYSPERERDTDRLIQALSSHSSHLTASLPLSSSHRDRRDTDYGHHKARQRRSKDRQR